MSYALYILSKADNLPTASPCQAAVRPSTAHEPRLGRASTPVPQSFSRLFMKVAVRSFGLDAVGPYREGSAALMASGGTVVMASGQGRMCTRACNEVAREAGAKVSRRLVHFRRRTSIGQIRRAALVAGARGHGRAAWAPTKSPFKEYQADGNIPALLSRRVGHGSCSRGA